MSVRKATLKHSAQGTRGITPHLAQTKERLDEREPGGKTNLFTSKKINIRIEGQSVEQSREYVGSSGRH